jgi:hypothetical protein
VKLAGLLFFTDSLRMHLPAIPAVLLAIYINFYLRMLAVYQNTTGSTPGSKNYNLSALTT